VIVAIGERLMEICVTLVEGVYPCNDKEYTTYIIMVL